MLPKDTLLLQTDIVVDTHVNIGDGEKRVMCLGEKPDDPNTPWVESVNLHLPGGLVPDDRSSFRAFLILVPYRGVAEGA